MMTPSLIARMQTELGAALPLWDLSSQSTVSFLSHSENTTFLARDPASGRSLVLRVQRIGYHTAAEIKSELAWIDALIAEEIVVTPRPVADGEGRRLSPIVLNGSPRQIAAFEFLNGKEPDPSDDLVAWFGKLGAISARLHAHSRRWKRPPDFQRKVWDFHAMLGNRPLWGDWRAGLGLRDDGRKLLEKVAGALEQRLDTYGHTNDRFGLVHADLRLANLLVDGARLGVIDFDDCGFSWFFYDFAAAVSFMEHEPVVAALQASWLDGYRAIAPVSREDELMLPIFVMLRRMLLTAWIASHSDTETALKLGTDYTDGTVAMGERFLGAL
jgi:Ser/Thr protein kinase RdoA (MazF antagonist)